MADLLKTGRLEELERKSRSLAAKRRYREANRYLAEAVAMVEQALSEAREKETLFYSREFASLEEEFKYALQRNDNYVLLTDMFIRSCPPERENRIPLIKRLVARNEELRAEAQSLMVEGKPEAAIKAVDEGTQNLIRALRIGGLSL